MLRQLNVVGDSNESTIIIVKEMGGYFEHKL